MLKHCGSVERGGFGGVTFVVVCFFYLFMLDVCVFVFFKFVLQLEWFLLLLLILLLLHFFILSL